MEWLKLFIPATISSVVLLSIIGFICRNWFIARITQSIKHEYDKDLENHKNKLRKETDSELAQLNGKVSIEVEKAKLKLNFYSKEQFELYNTLWLNLCELRNAMNTLWQDATSENLWDFQEKLLKAFDVLEQRAILIEPQHYNELREILQEFVNYQLGKDSLLKLRREQKLGRKFSDEQIKQLIYQNMDSREKLLKYIDQMKDCLWSQISGHS